MRSQDTVDFNTQEVRYITIVCHRGELVKGKVNVIY